MGVDVGIGEHRFNDLLGIECLVLASSSLTVDDLYVDRPGIGWETLDWCELGFVA